MNKILIITSLLFFGIDSFSQDSIDEPQNVIVNWEVGTSKSITQIDSTIIYANDSVFMASGMSSNYTIKIGFIFVLLLFKSRIQVLVN